MESLTAGRSAVVTTPTDGRLPSFWDMGSVWMGT
jgi:hypothetical protein